MRPSREYTFNFGKRMTHYRNNSVDDPKRKAMTRKEFIAKAESMGESVTIDWLASIELGQRRDLTLRDVMLLARVLDRPMIAIMCDLTQPFKEADLPTFKGKTNLEVVDECFGMLGDGLESYAPLGTIMYTAKKLALVMQTYESAFNALDYYIEPDAPEKPDAEGNVSGKAFLAALRKDEYQPNIDVIDNFLKVVVPLRQSLRQEGVLFPPDGPFRDLGDGRFEEFVKAAKQQHVEDTERFDKPIIDLSGIASPDEEQ